MNGILTRIYTPIGTFGSLVFDGFKCSTVERPWIDNQHLVSCIPEGTYLCRLCPSTKNIKVSDKAYQVLNVPDRTFIEIHYANYPTDVEGCIGLGEKYMIEQHMVTNSVKTVKAFMDFMQGQDFMLTIKGVS